MLKPLPPVCSSLSPCIDIGGSINHEPHRADCSFLTCNSQVEIYVLSIQFHLRHMEDYARKRDVAVLHGHVEYGAPLFNVHAIFDLLGEFLGILVLYTTDGTSVEGPVEEYRKVPVGKEEGVDIGKRKMIGDFEMELGGERGKCRHILLSCPASSLGRPAAEEKIWPTKATQYLGGQKVLTQLGAVLCALGYLGLKNL
ncbi:hypothetical protein K440DRAFT_678215 [Wilcoxina mikolae CBS 423.85]|nr:hypothetical protein K440DRAFT_678215 [Wilcoxina mikolae CBS 423.85]